ncbi:MAG TPA: OmpA family protein [Polyangiaceae bacterium]|nr:OmpA family protein [Polyangiaceae bacterium]
MKQPQHVSYEEVDPGDILQDEPLGEPADSALRPRRRSNVPLYALATLLLGVAGGLGVYTWQLLSEKAKLQGDVAGLTKAQTETQARVVELQEEKGREQALTAQVSGERDELRTALASATAELEKLQVANAQNNEQLEEFNKLRAQFQRMIDSGTLDISIRRGRMIVEMPSSVLFDSGSAELSEAGKDTVVKVAKVLRDVPRHRFLVGGHTDNVPATKQYKSNWELSAARAVRVTETLTSNGVPPKRLVIAGYSEFDPVATNGSAPGRQKNRRIEIILEPYVEQKMLQGLIEKTAPKAAPAKAAAKK